MKARPLWLPSARLPFASLLEARSGEPQRPCPPWWWSEVLLAIASLGVMELARLGPKTAHSALVLGVGAWLPGSWLRVSRKLHSRAMHQRLNLSLSIRLILLRISNY